MGRGFFFLTGGCLLAAAFGLTCSIHELVSPGSDAGGEASTEAGPNFCSTTPATFCEDFDKPMRLYDGGPGGWMDFGQSNKSSLDVTTYVSPPRSGNQLFKGVCYCPFFWDRLDVLQPTYSYTDLSLSFRIDAKDAGSGGEYVSIVRLGWSDTANKLYSALSLVVQADTTLKQTVSMIETDFLQSDGGSLDGGVESLLSAGIKSGSLGEWTKVSVDINHVDRSVLLTVNGEFPVRFPLNGSFTKAAALRLDLGADQLLNYGWPGFQLPWSIGFDNVIVNLKQVNN